MPIPNTLASRSKRTAPATPDLVADLAKEIATKRSTDIRVIATERLKLYNFVRINNQYERRMRPVRLKKFRARYRHRVGVVKVEEVGPDKGREKMYLRLSNGQIVRSDRVLRPDRPGCPRDARRNLHIRKIVATRIGELAKAA